MGELRALLENFLDDVSFHMKNEDFTCKRCKEPATRLSLSADGQKWICPACALREAKAAKLNAQQRAHLERQLDEREQLVRRRERAKLNFGHAEAAS